MQNDTNACTVETPSEVKKILLEFNDTAAPYPRHLTVTDLFEAQAAQCPGHAAVLTGEGSLSYGELNTRANQLAAFLEEGHGVGKGDVVAVRMERSQHLILAILGILKAGAVYLPLDMSIPEKRMEYIRDDSGFRLVINESLINEFLAARQAFPGENRTGRSGPSELCYIIYTSGTTGQPKGAMIEHHSLVNRLLWMQKNYALSAEDAILQKTSCAFDVSVWELLWWAIVGSKVVFLKDGHEKDPEQILEYISRHGVTVLHFVPSMLSQFLDHIENNPAEAAKLSGLKRVYCSGEALTGKTNRRFHDLVPGARLVNLYGPTEATIDVTFFECRPGLDIIPIGRPIDNTRVYILSEEGEMVPVGTEGRIFLAGVGLARGYLNQPGLTAGRFPEDPFFPGERMYDTGDLGKWLPDGNIEYLGRSDDQVKLRGFRIELNEINHHLEQQEEISVAHTLKIEEKLVAFLVPVKSAGPSQSLEAGLRSRLALHLPEYMIPHHFCFIEEVPVTGSGKADKRQLAAIFKAIQANAGTAAVKQELSGSLREMAEIWSQVLNIPVESIDPAKSFIQHGGDSLSMLQVVALCKRKGRKMTIKEFLLRPTLDFFEGNGAATMKAPQDKPVAATEEPFPLSPIQQFFFDHNRQGLNFIMHASYFIHPQYDTRGIRMSLDALVKQHDSLMLRFKKEKGMWQQYYSAGTTAYVLEESGPAETATLKDCTARALQAIDIQKGPLLYAKIFFENGRPVLFLACHHLVMDAVSWKIFLDELQSNYAKYGPEAVAGS